MPKARTPWKEKTSVIVFHMTPSDKAQYLQLLREVGLDSGLQAFMEWLGQQKAKTFLTEWQVKYLSTRSQVAALANRIGKRKLRLLAVKWKMLGGRADGSNHDELFGALMDSVLEKVRGVTLVDLILFKQFLATFAEAKALEAHVRKGAFVKTSPPPPP